MYASSHRRQCVRAVCISISIWIISFLLSFPLLVYYDTTMLYVFKDVTVFSSGNATKLSSYGWRQCRLAPTQRKGMEDPNEAAKRESDAQKVQLFMSVMQALFLYVVPLIVLLIFNAKLTRFLQENSRQMHRSLSDRRSDDAGTLCIVKSSDLGQTAAVRNLPARRMNVRKRNRTTALLIAMAASYAVLWLPFTVVSMLLDLRILYMEGNGAAVIERIDQSCKMISIMSICVNPFLYGFLNTNFRHEFTDIFNQWICYKLRTTTNVQQEYSTVASPRRQSSSHPPQVPASNRFLQLLQNPYVRRSSAPCSSFIKTSIARKGNVETSVMRSRPLAKRSSNYCCNGFSNDPLLEFRECDETTTEGVTSPRHMQPLSDDVSLL